MDYGTCNNCLKLFGVLIALILTHDNEVWGIYVSEFVGVISEPLIT